MFFGLLPSKPPIDEESAQWLFSVYAWIIEHCDGEYFKSDSRLILPSNAYFPGNADSPHGMAELIFGHVLNYAGMSRWPVTLPRPDVCSTVALPTLRISGRLRGDESAVATEPPGGVIEMGYDPNLVGNPEPLIASMAHGLAGVLIATVDEPLPGGSENWPFVSEVMAVAMGFGVVMANSAKTIQVRSCASCGPTGNRKSFLSEFDTTYALAIFCVLKDIPAKAVHKRLAPHLRGLFKRSMKDIARRHETLEQLGLMAA